MSVCRLFARENGLLMGGSGGLVICGSLAWLKQSSAQSALAIIPDTGANYLDQIYSDAWLAEKGISLLSRAELDEHLNDKRISDVDWFDDEELAVPATANAGATAW